ncbi:uncharacterized protein ARMOST_15371 [Armillaria ostoyae]|uniref:F-box domain-containing protein n=1 Tax=Armillaria ostoyae TaxID=47428 RepID=A0A284RT60_ARMOS|nr:uncharacterized protein ARMOST_15371 [Armillaria ostoyae]
MADNAEVSLPSIQEWFPEYMLRVSPEVRVKGSVPPAFIPPRLYVPPQPIRKSLLEDAPSHPSHTSSSSLRHQPAPDDEDEESKKHICAICHKRFLRPSSLNNHINTHTGATPYRCPLPGCGQEFNVRSNMLRHCRSHTNPVPSSSSSSLHDIPTENLGPRIRTSLDASFTEGQDQAGNLLQYSQSRPWQERTGMERESPKSTATETTVSKSMMNSFSNTSGSQERFCNLHRDLINDLPCELLQEIFSIVVATEDDNEEDPRKRTGQFRLSLVCKQWRDLIEACPTLWTGITITDFSPDHPVCFPPRVGSSPESTFPILVRILERSSNCDLDVKIDIWAPPQVPLDFQEVVIYCSQGCKGHLPFSFSSEHSRSLSLLLSTHAHRIRTLDVITRDWTTQVDLFSAFVNKPMPRLQYLRLRHDNSDITNEGPTLMKYLGHSSLRLEQWHSVMYPSLRSFSVQGMPLGSFSFGGGIRNLQLVGLPSDNLPTSSELRLVLSNLVNTLEILSLVCAVRDVEDSPIPLEPLTLPHVHTFSLGYGRAIKEVELSILQFLDIPTVRNLSIKDCHIASLPASDGAFTHIMKRLPLHQIVSLKLSNVRFEVREDYITSQDVLDGNPDAEEDLPIPLRFIRKLSAVKQLSTLRGDDEITLDDLARLINFSTVETMNIEADNWEIRDWDPALTFLHNRFQ